MSKIRFTVGLMFVFGLFLSNFSIHANAMDAEMIVPKEGPEEEGGINDQSSVDIKITKISDVKITKISDDVLLNNVMSTQSAGWNYIGYDAFYGTSKTFYSGGGNLRILIAQPYTGPSIRWLYKLVEEDPLATQTVKPFELPNSSGTYTIDFNVDSYKDGDNNKAELRLLKLTVPASQVATEWYD
ncbi:hypothetical protein Q8G35_18820 [Peribacillus simplex]|uniref:Uncharacterized protein n=2 Tax=Peribacillus TaxID=2675229 RepID=A0AA90SLR1_9BACI|nr:MULTISPECIES: hypothetical protein [Peribacillus]MDP1420380.1 hypothetical protein [Peribacillus simplex]MDP1453461.1 hypothetical protein [Peribacillus frigoritolerans]